MSPLWHGREPSRSAPRIPAPAWGERADDVPATVAVDEVIDEQIAVQQARGAGRRQARLRKTTTNSAPNNNEAPLPKPALAHVRGDLGYDLAENGVVRQARAGDLAVVDAGVRGQSDASVPGFYHSSRRSGETPEACIRTRTSARWTPAFA